MNLNQEGAHTATLEGKMSKKMLHQATEHAGHQFMADTATYYKVNVAGVVTKCFNLFFGEDQTEKIPQNNEDTCKKQETECILIYHQ